MLVPKTTLSLATTLCLTLLFPFSVSAATYCAAPSGSDNNSTSTSTPFKTIPKAVTASEGGDVIEVLPGNYPKVNISKSGPSPTNRITMKGYGATMVGDSSGNGFTVTEGYSHGVHIQGKNIDLTDITARNNVTENHGSNDVCGSNSGWGSGGSGIVILKYYDH